ncbi:hypothetical protein KI387_041779, partial [Taxus chinensis]
AAALNREAVNLMVVDVIPLSLGIETAKGIMRVIVPRNSTIPTHRKEWVTTSYDYVTSMAINVYQGERRLTAHNKFLGKFVLAGIESAPSRVPEIRVRFRVDADGMLTVSAQDMKTKARNQIVINCNESETRTIGKEEVDRLVAWAQRFRMKDEAEEERIIAKYEFQRYICNMKIRVNEARTRGNIGESVAQDIILTLNSYQQWLQNHSPSPSPHKLRHKFCELQEKCGNALKNGRGKFCKLPDV